MKAVTGLFRVALIGAVVFTQIAATAPQKMQPHDVNLYLHPQRLVEIGGRRLNLVCTGQGSPPTVILAAGMLADSSSWRRVQPAMSQTTRVCSYDRAGMGFSDPAGAPRDASAIVRDIYCTGHGSPAVILAAGAGDTTFAGRKVQPTISTSTRVCSYGRAGLGFSDGGPIPRDAKAAINDLHHSEAGFASLSLVGTWQSVFHAPAGGDVRRVMEITKAARGYHAVIHSIDETDVPIITSNVMVDGNTITLKFDMNTDPWSDYHRVWKAQLSADGRTLAGPWFGPGVDPIATTYRRVPKASWPVLVSKSTLVNVDSSVRDEVLDWGGVGRAVVLLAGLGDTGHSFVKIIPALKNKYHVYSVTRRGFGNSDTPNPTKENYSAQRLGEDVAAILTSLKIQKPILIGHSIAGEELTYMGTYHANRVAGLIYLDAGYGQAFDGGLPNPDLTMTPAPGLSSVALAVLHGEASFRGPITVPILAIFAAPDVDNSPSDEALAKAQVDVFAKGLPAATVIRIPNAHHYVYISNTDEVLRDINAFIAKLPH